MLPLFIALFCYCCSKSKPTVLNGWEKAVWSSLYVRTYIQTSNLWSGAFTWMNKLHTRQSYRISRRSSFELSLLMSYHTMNRWKHNMYTVYTICVHVQYTTPSVASTQPPFEFHLSGFMGCVLCGFGMKCGPIIYSKSYLQTQETNNIYSND